MAVMSSHKKLNRGNGVTDLENRSLLVLGSKKHESRPPLKVGA